MKIAFFKANQWAYLQNGKCGTLKMQLGLPNCTNFKLFAQSKKWKPNARHTYERKCVKLNAPYRWQWHKNSCKLSSLYINLCYAKKTHVVFFTDTCTYVYSNIKLSKTISIVILAAIYFDATTILLI